MPAGVSQGCGRLSGPGQEPPIRDAARLARPLRRLLRALPAPLRAATIAAVAVLALWAALAPAGERPLTAADPTPRAPASPDAAGPTPPSDRQAPPASAAAPATAGPVPAGALQTVVERIVDGDTLYLAGLPERARLIGIDTPETRHPDRGVECFGRAASARLAALAPPGTAVLVAFDVERADRYGRPLVYLYRGADGLFVNLAMVAEGYASVHTVPPNVRHHDSLLAAQRRARAAGRGLWAACPDRG